jgi:fructokinase
VLAVVHELLAVADVVKASAEDVEWLQPGRSPEEVASAWLARGPALVVITRGGAGALAAGRSSGSLSRPGMPVDVVDTVGAGDSFMSALLAGLAHRDLLGADRRQALRAMVADDVAALLDEAIAASAVTCSRQGADPPRAAELPGRNDGG